MIQVWYHANCSDGLLAAWLFRCHFPSAVFVPVQYGQDPPLTCAYDTVFIVDFSYPRRVMEELTKRCASVLVLDHHKSAERNLEGLPNCVFDMSKSGCRLAYEYLLKQGVSFSRPVSVVVDLVEARDLGKFDDERAQMFAVGLRSYPIIFDTLDAMHQEPAWVDRLCREGQIISRYRTELVKQHVKKARTCRLADVAGLAVPCSCPDIFSEVGRDLAILSERYGAVWYETPENYVFSLRADGNCDVSKIAERYGGGGHQNAAGFIIPKNNYDRYQLPLG